MGDYFEDKGAEGFPTAKLSPLSLSLDLCKLANIEIVLNYCRIPPAWVPFLAHLNFLIMHQSLLTIIYVHREASIYMYMQHFEQTR